MKKCLGCDEDVPEEFIIHKYDRFILNHAIQKPTENTYPFNLGHLVLMPRKRKKPSNALWHPIDITDLTDDEWKGIMNCCQKLSRLWKKFCLE